MFLAQCWKLKTSSRPFLSSKSFKQFQNNIALAYIYQLTKFGELISCGSEDISKKEP